MWPSCGSGKWIHRWRKTRRPRLAERPLLPAKTIRKKRDLHQEEILAAKQRFPHFGAQKLKSILDIDLSHDRIHKVLQANEKCIRRMRPWRKIKRFERPYAYDPWQMDTQQSHAKNRETVFILSTMDDHYRAILASQVLTKDLTQVDSIRLVCKAIGIWGKPKKISAGNSKEFPRWPAVLGIKHTRARARLPQAHRKIERWHGSLEYEGFAYPDRSETPAGFGQPYG